MTVNELNRHTNWRDRAARAKAQHAITVLVLNSHAKTKPALPVIVTVTRFSPVILDKHDGLPASQKFVVDGIAEFLGVDDSDPRVEWRYDQVRSTRYSVVIEIKDAS